MVRVASSLPPPSNPTVHAGAAAAKRSLQIVASFDAGCTVLGAAPFGVDVAVLCWGAPSSSGSGDGTQDGAARPAGAAAGPGPAIVDASTTADELPVSSPAGGGPPSQAGSNGPDGARLPGSSPGQQQQQQVADPSAAGDAGPQLAAAGAASAAAAAEQAAREEQQLSLCFFTRSGQLLASDALSLSARADERRWHQLALLYSGTADLRLAAAAAAAGRSGSLGPGGLGTPVRSSAASTPAGGSPRASAAANGAGAAAGAALEADAAPGGGSQQGAAGGEQQQQGAVQEPVRRYKWWRDGEEPTYLVSGPQVSCWSFSMQCPTTCCLRAGECGLFAGRAPP